MPDDEARDQLDELARHATQDRYVLSLTYNVGDVVIWGRQWSANSCAGQAI
jgi:hypothetical protein